MIRNEYKLSLFCVANRKNLCKAANKYFNQRVHETFSLKLIRNSILLMSRK